ncbi:SO_0444 family Cu/Zn efflux transporter [Colwellia sp. 6_MG-2023]|uniref:SO_0444 family Cu/Zn efflux transporter n=1 Tax=Colwellia sp. 6_MG-2023 TaxID=3062676 RepID=UPI0026E1847B|nr:SO_0444 family Cu/Zn efflux transporter [Colwellia sp. 6_MG-2023]MDO6488203.1 SO_0444 family Cu/Zn efflux transporter [Colwellia sp. 6_MG-2023]
MEHLSYFINNFIDLSAEASPWLLLGLLIAGLMKAWVPSEILSKHLGRGKSAVVKAALIGAPLPLCSCGVIPVAAELRRSGASAPATASFLVATPETGIDSVSVSYALLGPVFAIYRPLAAIMSAIITGLLVATIKDEKIKKPTTENKKSTSCCTSPAQPEPVTKPITSSCCSSKKMEASLTPTPSSCCSTPPSSSTVAIDTITEPAKPLISKRFVEKTKTGVYYASTQLIDDIIIWLVVGLVFATIIRTFLPNEFLLSYGSGLPAMLLMIAISIPMYICATASTPIAAGFIMAGLSPGTALVFMMAGPATNISTLGVIKSEMGSAVLTRYLLGVALSAIGFALILDYSLSFFAVSITDQMAHSHEMLPQWFGLTCAALIALLAIKPLRKLIF